MNQAGGADRALLGPIPADRATCTALHGGAWADPCAGGGGSGGSATCKVNGDVVFRRPCGVCYKKD
jgi:hypothetical protein